MVSVSAATWLSRMDSNHDYQNQNLGYCLYTTGKLFHFSVGAVGVGVPLVPGYSVTQFGRPCNYM